MDKSIQSTRTISKTKITNRNLISIITIMGTKSIKIIPLIPITILTPIENTKRDLKIKTFKIRTIMRTIRIIVKVITGLIITIIIIIIVIKIMRREIIVTWNAIIVIIMDTEQETAKCKLTI